MTTTVVGLGHPAAGDDAVGLWVARALAREGVSARESGDATALLSLLADGQRVILVDAVLSARREVMHLGPGALARGEVTPLSCHGLGVSQALELAELLYPEAHARLEIVAIPIAQPRGASDRLSPATEALIDEACALVRRLLATAPPQPAASKGP